MRIDKFLPMLAFCCVFLVGFADFSILATVNDENISNYDLNKRKQWYKALYAGADGKDRDNNFFIDMIADDLIMREEAAKLGIGFTESELQDYMKYISSELGVYDMEAYASAIGIDYNDFKMHVTSQLLWHKTVTEFLIYHIGVTDEEVNDFALSYKTKHPELEQYVFAKYDMDEACYRTVQSLMDQRKDLTPEDIKKSGIVMKGPTTLSVKFIEMRDELKKYVSDESFALNKIAIFSEEADRYYLLIPLEVIDPEIPSNKNLRNELAALKLSDYAGRYIVGLRNKNVVMKR